MNQQEQKITSEILQKNFDLDETPADTDSFERIKELLIDKLHFLLDHDFEKLLWILYRIDVSEEKAKIALSGNSNRPPAEILADLIIERQMEKAQSRLKYGKEGPQE